ncbi:MAG: hypothetical protein HY002_21375 [Candidatus Rokubacteria bacterium]|nr:hypothetical protein [Candidatus Rokubacteria bacterium]
MLAASAAAQAPSPLGRLLDDLLPHRPAQVQLPALKAIEASGNRAAIPALIELLRFELDVPGERHAAVLSRWGRISGCCWRRIQ